MLPAGFVCQLGCILKSVLLFPDAGGMMDIVAQPMHYECDGWPGGAAIHG